MITTSFSLTATERVLPKLALDFTTASLDPRVTFTRTTSASNPATYVNSSGYVTSATNNQPRFDYDPVTLICKGLLIEESRTNLLVRSQEFNAWTKNATTVTADTSVAPDGLLTGDKLISSAVSGFHSIAQSIATKVASTPYTFSFYAKAGEIGFCIPNFSSALTGSALSCTVNLLTGAVTGISSGLTVTTASVGNSWWRITLTATGAANTTGFTSNINATDSSGNSSFTGDGISGIYIWGAQLEAGAFATSYIPTITTALTRNDDVATMTGTNFSDWWTATNGASDIWLIPKSTSTLAYMSFDDNTANNKIVIANSTTSGQSIITSGGVLQATLTAGTITANVTNKVGCSWNTNNCAATANATTPATTASATIPTVTQLRIGNSGSAYANAWIQKLFYWPQRITNNEIQAFTK